MQNLTHLIERIDQLTGNFLSAVVVNSDQAESGQISLAVRMAGKVRTHPIDNDRESGGLEYHYEPVDHVEEFTFDEANPVPICQQITSVLLHVEGVVIDAVSDGREWLETELHLNYHLDHQP